MRASDLNKLHMAIVPAARTAAATTVNGVAAASAVGIDFSAQRNAEVELCIGAVGVSSAGVALTFHTSTAGSNPVGLLTAIDDAIMAIEAADANSVKTGKIRLDNLPAGHTFLYAQAVQGSTDSVAYGVNVLTSEGVKNPNDNTPEFDV